MNGDFVLFSLLGIAGVLFAAAEHNAGVLLFGFLIVLLAMGLLELPGRQSQDVHHYHHHRQED